MLPNPNCLVAQSGGPTTVINASLCGVIKKVLDSECLGTIYGAVHGIQGVLHDNLINLNDEFENCPEKLELLKVSPAMYLGSCRYKLPEEKNDIKDYKKIFNLFSHYKIGYFFYIGGNDSMDTVLKLASYAESHHIDVKIIGIPKTIDNDLLCTDHTPGFGSAAKYIASSILEIAHDTYIYNTKTVNIVEIMGRNAGWLTAASALARNQYSTAPHLIYLPEKPFSTGAFIKDLREQLDIRNHIIVAVSEGIKNQHGTYISAQSQKTDQFGHAMLSGTGKCLEDLVLNAIGCKVRSIELNILQRCAAHIASAVDIEEAFLLGTHGVEAALNGETKKMVTLTRISNSPYSVTYNTEDIAKIANYEKTIPLSWINECGNDVTEEFIDYALPLIQGEPALSYKNGLPEYLAVKHLHINS